MPCVEGREFASFKVTVNVSGPTVPFDVYSIVPVVVLRFDNDPRVGGVTAV